MTSIGDKMRAFVTFCGLQKGKMTLPLPIPSKQCCVAVHDGKERGQIVLFSEITHLRIVSRQFCH